LLRRSFMATNQIAHRERLGNLTLHAQIQRQIVLSLVSAVSLPVSEIAVQRKPIDIVVTLFEHFPIPLEVSAHEWTAGSTCNQLEFWVHIPHLSRRILRLYAIFRGRHVANLPGAIHLIAEAPVLDFPWFRDSVLPPQITPACALIYIAVLH